MTMSRYFARLVQRAAGAEQKTHAAPPPSSSSMPAGSDAHDPFEAAAPLEPAPASPRQSAQRQDLSTPAIAPPLTQPASLPVRAEPPIDSPLTQPQLAPRAEGPAPPRETQPFEQAEPAEIVEHTRIERETVREILHQDSDKPLKSVLAPPAPSRMTPVAERPPAQPVMTARIQQPAAPALEPVAPESRPAPEKAAARMTPMPDARPAPEPGPHPEPRLVIGRMQVEVLAAAPVPQAQPRVIQRRAAAPHAPSAPSQLHFGLGQM